MKVGSIDVHVAGVNESVVRSFDFGDPLWTSGDEGLCQGVVVDCDGVMMMLVRVIVFMIMIMVMVVIVIVIVVMVVVVAAVPVVVVVVELASEVVVAVS